ncbi:1774_t:CDS:1, partial [Paraglomus brasilianum]
LAIENIASVKQGESVCDRGSLSEASNGESSSSRWPADFIAQKLWGC